MLNPLIDEETHVSSPMKTFKYNMRDSPYLPNSIQILHESKNNLNILSEKYNSKINQLPKIKVHDNKLSKTPFGEYRAANYFVGAGPSDDLSPRKNSISPSMVGMAPRFTSKISPRLYNRIDRKIRIKNN